MTAENDDNGSRGSQPDSCFLHNLSTNSKSAGTTLSVSEYQSYQGDQSQFQDLKAVWSLLLSKYTNTSTVLFGAISDSGILEKWRAYVNEEAPMVQAVSLVKVRNWEYGETGSQDRFNTFLLEDIGLKAIGRLAQVKKHVDLTIGIDYSKSRFRICIYSPESFLDQDQAELLMSSLIHTLKSLQSTLQLKSVDLLSDLHRWQIGRWNRASPTGSLGDTIHHCIERQCFRRPEAEAVCAWDGSLSYGELEILSSEICEVLYANDVLPGMIIPLVFEKSKWTVVAMLGVLKAGAAFVTIDPSFPQARVQAICYDVKAPFILCSATQKYPTSNLNREFITIPIKDSVTLSSQTKENYLSASDPNQPAYIAYTSGSTGTPKGIVISHGNFCTNMALSSPLQNLGDTSRVLQFASYAFDVSILETLTPLMLGGSVCIPSESQRVDNLQQAILDLRVNWIELVPSVARLLDFNAIPEVKTLVIGGETMRPSDISQWAGRLNLTQAYGPAECAVVSTIQSSLSQDSDPRNIGYSAAGSSWIVEPENHSKLVPIGAVGELVIGGPIVGKGYLNQPEQTAQSFISDVPWSKRPEAYYKTGDLARLNSDGSIVYMGRKDTQVKIRGQRVELGEIEHLAQEIWSDITPIAEVVRIGDHDPILVLFIGQMTPESNIILDSEELLMEFEAQSREKVRNLQSSLREILPRYMIPDVFVRIKRLPLMSSGKVDRKMLRNTMSRLSDKELQSLRNMTRSSHNRPSENPAEPSETLHGCIAQMFSIILGKPLNHVDVSANFFHLGGDSALAIALVNEARVRHCINITVASIFENPTVATLAQYIKTCPAKPESCQQILPFSLINGDVEHLRGLGASQCGIDPEAIEDIYPCTPLQERLLAWTVNKPGAFQADFVFKLPSSIDWEKLHNALRMAIRASPILRTRISLNPEFLRLSRGLQVVVREDIAWADATTNCQNKNIIMSTGTPLFHYTTAHEPSPTLKLTLHHALFDSYSYSQIVNAVETAYNGTPVVTSPFVPFIKYLLNLDELAARSFWANEFVDLAAIPFPANVPPGHIPRKVERYVHSFCLHRCNEHEITLSTVCRLAWALVVARYTRSLDVMFGVTVTGRNSSEIAGIVGPTITTFPLRISIHSDEKVHTELKRLQKHALDMMPYELFGIHRIRQCSSEAVSASQFQSLLIVQPTRTHFPKARSHSLLELMEVDTLEQQIDASFATQVLTIICEYAEDTMKLRGVFDPEVVHPDKVKGYLHQMSRLVNMILSSSSDTVGVLLQKATEYIDPEDLNEERRVLDEVERTAQTFLGQNTPLRAEWVIPIDTNTPKLALFVGFDGGSGVNPSCVFKLPDNDTRARLHQAMAQLQSTLSDAVMPSICLPVHVSHESIGFPSRADLQKEASKLPLEILESYMSPQEPSVVMEKFISNIQTRLRRIMGVVLHIDINDVGVHESFFALGGDSILAMQVVAQCRDENINITAHDIFDAKTIHRIALRASPGSKNMTAVIQDRPFLPKSMEADLKQLNKLPRSAQVEDVYPCTDPHKGLLRKMNSSFLLSYTIWEVTANGALIDIERLLLAWGLVSKRHAALRTVLTEFDGIEYHVVLDNYPTEAKALPQLSSHDLAAALGESRIEIQQGQITPYRFTVYQSDAGQVLCKLEGSHAFLDASSVLIILHELSLAYRGLPFPTPAPPYRSWVTYLDSWKRNSQHLDYWRDKLSGLSQCLWQKHSMDRLCRDNCANSQLQCVVNPLVDTEILQRFCSRYEVTMTILLQLSWALVLQEYCQSNDVCFGTTISGRDAPVDGVQDMVGSIFNVLPRRFRLSAGSSFLETLEWSQKNTLEDKSHQFCSLVDLEDLLLPGNQNQPLFNTCFFSGERIVQWYRKAFLSTDRDA